MKKIILAALLLSLTSPSIAGDKHKVTITPYIKNNPIESASRHYEYMVFRPYDHKDWVDIGSRGEFKLEKAFYRVCVNLNKKYSKDKNNYYGCRNFNVKNKTKVKVKMIKKSKNFKPRWFK